MKKLLLLLTLLLILPSLGIAQVKVKIIVKSLSIKSGQQIYISGNQSTFGNWNPMNVKLDRFNDSVWTKEFSFEKNTLLEFKFTKGSWDTEALDEEGNIPENYSFTLQTDTTISIRIPNWKDSRTNLQGQVTGNVVYLKNFKGRNVLPRDIVVWLPPGYDSVGSKYYPVLYMNDGQNIFDPATSSFGVDWQLDETVDGLIRNHKIHPIIIVGIYNSYKRGREYADTKDGEDYLNFIIRELKPFIDKSYKTLPDKENTAIGGSSLGGLISLIAVWKYPDVFTKAACLSPALNVDEYNYVSTVDGYKGARKFVKIYIDIGGVGLENELKTGYDEMIEALIKQGFKVGSDILAITDPSSEHNERAWAKRSWRFLEFFFGNDQRVLNID